VSGTEKQNARRVLTLWGLVVLVGFVLVFCSNVPMMRYVEHARAQNYMTYLVAADQAMKRDDMATALEELEHAFELAPPEAAMPHKVAGDIYYHFKDWDRAATAYRRAIELGATEVGIRLNAVWALVELARYREAAAAGENALAEGFTHPRLARSIAEAYRRAGDHAASVPYYEQALQSLPQDLYLLEQLRQAYQRLGNHESAEAMQARIEETQARMATLSGAPR